AQRQGAGRIRASPRQVEVRAAPPSLQLDIGRLNHLAPAAGLVIHELMWAGLPPTGWMFNRSSWRTMQGACSSTFIAALILTTMGSAVRGGAAMACQVFERKSATPA